MTGEEDGAGAEPIGVTVLIELLDGAARPARGPAGGLTECVRCRKRVVSPVCEQEVDERSWWLRLRCRACGFAREVVITDREADELASELDSAEVEIELALERLRLGRLPEEVSRLEAAFSLPAALPHRRGPRST